MTVSRAHSLAMSVLKVGVNDNKFRDVCYWLGIDPSPEVLECPDTISITKIQFLCTHVELLQSSTLYWHYISSQSKNEIMLSDMKCTACFIMHLYFRLQKLILVMEHIFKKTPGTREMLQSCFIMLIRM
jgi:hypothetical protein